MGEIEDLIELAKQAVPTEIAAIQLTDFEKFSIDLNLAAGLDEFPFQLLWDYYRLWTKVRPRKHKFGQFLTERYEKHSYRAKVIYFLNESVMTLDKEKMMQKVGEMLYERRKKGKTKKKRYSKVSGA